MEDDANLDRADHRQVARAVQRLWNSGSREYTLHCVAEMESERITENDIQHVLRFGKIVTHEEIDQVWRYRFHGRSVDGARTGVVVKLHASLIVVTTFLL